MKKEERVDETTKQDTHHAQLECNWLSVKTTTNLSVNSINRSRIDSMSTPDIISYRYQHHLRNWSLTMMHNKATHAHNNQSYCKQHLLLQQSPPRPAQQTTLLNLKTRLMNRVDSQTRLATWWRSPLHINASSKCCHPSQYWQRRTVGSDNEASRAWGERNAKQHKKCTFTS
jgi:hypothetical protein